MHIQLAWRNIWRNPRRTTVILIAVVIGVWSMVFLGAVMRGMLTGMIDHGISNLTGDLQIHQKGYRQDPVVDKYIPDLNKMADILNRTLPPDTLWAPRVRVNAVSSNARHSSGVTLVGIVPQTEAKVSFMGPEVIQGRHLTEKDPNGIIVGQALLEKFETRINKKLVLMSQDTNQDIASRAFRIIGVYRAEMRATEKQFVFVHLASAQKMLGLGKGISEISIKLPEGHLPEPVAAELMSALPGEEFEVHTWRELLPLLTVYLDMFDKTMVIWFIVVFIAMGFGIVNTTLMAVYERMREFGILKALGMKPWWIIRSVLYESMLLLTMGMIVGNGLSYVCARALSVSGIDLSYLAEGAEYSGITRIIYPDIAIQDIFTANFVVLVLGLLVSLYPAIKAARFSAVQALTHT